MATFFNGDVKIFDGKDKEHKELIQVNNLHEDKIEDVLYLKSDLLQGNKFLVSCSGEPSPDLKVSLVSQKSNDVRVVCQVDAETAEALGGWNSLAINPIETEMFASSSKNFVKNKAPVGEAESNKLGSI